MKKIISLAAILAAFVTIASCVAEEDPSVADDIGIITGEASHISCRNAEISGKAHIPGTTTPVDLSFGVLYSTSSGVLIGTAKELVAKNFDSEYNFTITTDPLEPDTTYYYRSYIIQNTEISYGEVKSFKTLDLSSMILTTDVSEIHPKDATFSAFLDLTDCKYDAIEYGFEVTSNGGDVHKIKSNNYSEQAFSVKDESLSKDTRYSYAAYVTLDGLTYKGEAKSFTTELIQASITAESSNVSYHTATISGALTVTSEGTFTKSATLYYSNAACTLEELKSNGIKKVLTLNNDGKYIENLSSLISNTKYYYAVVSMVDDVEFTSEVKSFTTLEIQAAITAESSNVSYHTATISGALTVSSEGTFTKSADLYYSSTASTLEALQSSGTKKTLTLNQDGTYSESLSSLVSNTKYYYAIVSKVDDIEFVTDVKSFNTLEIQASITAEASNIKCKTATISGALTVTSEGTFTKSATLYYSRTASTLEALKSNGTKKTLTLNEDGSYNADLSSLISNTKYNFVIVSNVDDAEFASSVNNLTTLTPPAGAIELGLSVLWATCNVGASNPEEYGTYFAWGDLTGQTWNGSSWSGGGFSSYPSYELDANNNLKPEYDAAHVNLGGSWRMPTKAEFQELINNCASTWTSNYNDTGVAGSILTSTKEGYTDKFIFLPAAGYGGDGYLFSFGSSGYYWSSTFTNSSNGGIAWDLYFRSNGVYTNDSGRRGGQSVRPVSE